MVAEHGLIERGIAGICRVVLWVSTAAIFAILAANTVLRYVTGSSLQWANEIPELLFPWLVMAGVVLAALQKAHIATTFLMEAVQPGIRRVVATVSWLVVAGLYATLTVATFRMLEIVHDEKSPILQLPGSITYACVMVGVGRGAVGGVRWPRRAWRSEVPAAADTEPHVPTAHW